MSRVTILGAGPAGLGAAVGLARRGHQVTVIEQSDRIGGNAGSFELFGLPVDYGSHRLHPAAEPAVLALVRELLGDGLLRRRRHGRIRLLGRWIRFPLRPLDLALRLDPRFAAGALIDVARKVVSPRESPKDSDTFASVLERSLGTAICREFYFPYARKIWGLEPDAISPVQAYKRVSAGSITMLLKRLLPRVASAGNEKRGYFYYPRDGFGAISQRLREAAERAGATLRLSNTVARIDLSGPAGPIVETTSSTGTAVLESNHVWSTIPLTTLSRLVAPSAPADVLQSASRLELRAMVLVYLVLDMSQFTEYDAHYFPAEDFPFTRVSEPKNYSGRTEPANITVLCAEIPCSRAGAVWSAAADDLGRLVRDGLARAGLAVRCRVLDVAVRRLPAAYPIYRCGYEDHFNRVAEWIDGRDGLLSFGRQGLYAHDNTHHALAMALAAVNCLGAEGRMDLHRWTGYRHLFEQHVVED